jgi:hypothetical protein
VLPLRRCGLVLSALVIGSMAPDSEYFFGLRHSASHAMPGAVTFTFPLALAVLIIFHAIVKWPLISLMPAGLQARVIRSAQGFRWLPATRFLLILLSLATGIATHILLDGFTHPESWVVLHCAALRTMVPIPAHRPQPMHAVLQYAITAVGVLALAICTAFWYRRATAESGILRPQFSAVVKWTILSVMLATAVVLGYMNGAAWYGQLFRGASQRARFVLGFAISTATVAVVEMFGFSVIWQTFLAGRQTEAGQRNHGVAAPVGEPVVAGNHRFLFAARHDELIGSGSQ